MIQQTGRNILQNTDANKVVPNDVYEQLLKNMSDRTADTDTQKKSRKTKKSRKLKTSKKAKNKSKKNKKK